MVHLICSSLPLVLLAASASAASASSASTSAACTRDEDCSLNGVCDAASGACACDAEWVGDACHTLNLLPPRTLAAAYPPPALAHNTTSWGGSVLNVSGTYHMYAAVMSNACGMTTWTTNSFIQHAVSNTPEGPYEPREVVMPPFAHNPTALRAPDGTYLIYHIGCGTPVGGAPPCTDCAGGKSGKSCHGPGEMVACDDRTTNILHAASPDGPWGQLNAPFVKSATMGTPYQIDNPTVSFFPNGSLLMLGRGGNLRKESQSDGVITAPGWRGPYTMHTAMNAGSGGAGPDIEDPFVWSDRRGHFHALFHKFTDEHPNSGGHGFSRDGFAWTLSDRPAYTTDVTTADGAVHAFNRRERPHLMLDAATGTRPVMLFSTLTQWSDSGANDGHDNAFTHAQWINGSGGGSSSSSSSSSSSQ